MNGTTDRSGKPPQVVIVGGTVMDPATGLERRLDVEVTDGEVSGLREPGQARDSVGTVVDATGCVVAPGFIDLHSHAINRPSMLVQARDGVTTALELEGGSAHVAADIERMRAAGAPINFGFSAGWALARMEVLEGAPADEGFTSFVGRSRGARWRAEASTAELAQILDRVEAEMAAGGLGIGILVGYAPGTAALEYTRLAGLAARHGLPTFSHARHKFPDEPGSAMAGALELVGAAAGTGAHMHLCHITSTSLRQVDEVYALVERAARAGNRVTTEAYPYGAGMTTLAASFLDPDQLHRFGMRPEDITVYPSGERPASLGRLHELRREMPWATAVIHYLDEGDAHDRRSIEYALEQPDVVIASDAIPYTDAAGTVLATGAIGHGAVSHPRTAGTFSRFIRLMRDRLGLMECLRRCSYLPAQVMAEASPGFARKGRLEVGADADLVVFDPLDLTDRATYDEPWRSSHGMRHVLVGGEPVVLDGSTDGAGSPGRALVRG